MNPPTSTAGRVGGTPDVARDGSTSGPTAQLPRAGTSPILDDALSLLTAARPRPTTLLDAPCGSGYLAARAIAAGWRVVACDIDTSLYRGPAAAQVVTADLSNEIPLPDASIDAVACCEGIEHVENPWRAIREFRRVLRSRGDAVFSLPNTVDVRQRWRHLRRGAFAHYAPSVPTHVNLMGPLLLAHALELSGFSVVDVRGARRPYGGLPLLCLTPLFRISRRSGLSESLRAMLSTSSVLRSRTVLIHARAVDDLGAASVAPA